MARVSVRAWLTVISSVSLGAAALAAQIVSSGQAPVAGQPRDMPPPPPAVRRIPIGTSTISGTITAADTGRPIRGARVSVNGTTVVPGAGYGAVVGGAMGSVPAGAPPGVVVGGISVVGVQPGGVATVGGVPLTGRGGFGTSVNRTVVTDASGQFSFPRLPAGQFTLMVVQQQFLQTFYGQKRVGGQGTTIRLTDGQQLNLKIQMMRGGVITGTIYGEDGEPQRNVPVRGLRYLMVNGVRRLQQTGFANTDDRGVYRLFGLQPGDYLVSATPNQSESQMYERMDTEMAAIEQAIASGAVDPPAAPGLPSTVSVPINRPQPGGNPMPPTPPPSYLPVYAPSSLIPTGATTVAVTGGDERAGVDIQLRLAQASQVQGTVATALEQGVTVQVSLINDDPTMDGVSNNSTRPDQTGRFTFRAIAPGKYTVFAYTVPAPSSMTFVNGQPVQPTQPVAPPRLTDAQKLWGRAAVTVEGQSVVEVNLPLRAARTISGMVVFDMAKAPDLTRVRPSIFLTPAPSVRSIPMMSGPPSVQIEPDGRFTLTGVLPGRYSFRGGFGMLKSAVVAGQDTADFPLEFTGEHDVMDAVLTFTDKTSELTGTLTDAAGKPAPDYTVIVAPSDNRYWTPGSRRIVTSRPSTDGRYVFRGLPPGDYVLAVVTDLENGAQYDPEFLRSLSTGALRVGIIEGGKVAQDLRVK
jgi:hypothetical protein